MKIDHKCNETVNTIQTVYTRKQYPIAFNRKSGALKSPLSTKINELRGALSKNTLFYKCFLVFLLFAIILQFGVPALRLFLSDLC